MLVLGMVLAAIQMQQASEAWLLLACWETRNAGLQHRLLEAERTASAEDLKACGLQQPPAGRLEQGSWACWRWGSGLGLPEGSVWMES